MSNPAGGRSGYAGYTHIYAPSQQGYGVNETSKASRENGKDYGSMLRGINGLAIGQEGSNFANSTLSAATLGGAGDVGARASDKHHNHRQGGQSGQPRYANMNPGGMSQSVGQVPTMPMGFGQPTGAPSFSPGPGFLNGMGAGPPTRSSTNGNSTLQSPANLVGNAPTSSSSVAPLSTLSPGILPPSAFTDFNAYAAMSAAAAAAMNGGAAMPTSASASAQPTASQSVSIGGLPMMQQASHASNLSSTSSAGLSSGMLPGPGPLVSDGSFANAHGASGPSLGSSAGPGSRGQQGVPGYPVSSLQGSPFPGVGNPMLNAQAMIAAAMAASKNGQTNPMVGAQSPATLSFPGTGSGAMGNGAPSGSSAQTGADLALQNSLNGAFGGASPLFAQNAFAGAPGSNPAAAAAAVAAGLGVPGLFGVGGFSVPGVPGGLGMSMPMGSPHLSQQMSDASMQAGSAPVVRTVYVGNLPGDASVDELLSLVRYGPIESVKILPDKSCAFISFLDPNVAAAFHSDANLRKLQLHGQELKIGWGKPTSIPAPILQAVQQHGATRNVYLGNLDETYTEQTLRDELSRFGHLDQVKIVRDKNIGFAHFLSIANAMKVVQELPKDPAWQGRRVNYGKDRCAYVPRNQHQQQQHNQMAAVMAAQAASQVTGFPSPFLPLSPTIPMSPAMSPMVFQGGFIDPAIINGNRTVYLGNLHPDTTCEDICNTIRGGILQEVRYIPDKHICFVTFVLAESALALFQFASQQGITIKNRRLKFGWGKPSGPCPPGIAAIVNAGGSRNVYIGNIDDFETFTLDKIKDDLSEFGEIEQVNALQDKSCAFVNFTKISSAVKAIEALKAHPEYSRFKIAYGKDRVGNVARTPFMRRGHSHPGGSANNNNNNNGSPSAPAIQAFSSPQLNSHGQDRSSRFRMSQSHGSSNSGSGNPASNGPSLTRRESSNGNAHAAVSSPQPEAIIAAPTAPEETQ